MNEEPEDTAEDGTVTKILSEYNVQDKRGAFIREYFIDFNATKAAIRAGYAEPSAQQQSSRLLSNDVIAKVISKIKTAKAMALEFGKQDVIGLHIEIIRDPTSTKSERQKSADALSRIYGMNDDKLKLAGNLRHSHDEWIKELEKDEEP